MGTMTVLILVLMEDTLRGLCYLLGRTRFKVLILVLMEDTLRGQVYFDTEKDEWRS